jgi:hypothetical protein
MSNPLTALNADVNESAVNTLLETISRTQGSCEITLLSTGSYGVIFKIRLLQVMGKQPDCPFNTFIINSNGALNYTSDNTFCCKLVPILEQAANITITRPNEVDIQQHTSTSLSFNNECNKQRQIYALTNHNLNSVCLPLFYFNIVNLSTETIFTGFIRFVFQQTSITVTSPPDLHYGISFMPFSPNIHTTIRTPRTTQSTIVLLTGETAIQQITTSINESYSKYQLDEDRIIEIFQLSLFMYPFVSVVSLLMRLYSVGYCHGDLHSGNIVVYPSPSGMTTRKGVIIYFGPTFSLIDTGFAYKHDQVVPSDFLTNYDSFKAVLNDIITRKAKKLGYNMLTHPPYNWFPQVFMKNIKKPMLDETRCSVIFKLLQHYDTYRVNFETRQLGIFNTLHPEQLEVLRIQNNTISKSVVSYIRSLQRHGNPLELFNVYGGRRNVRSHSRSYHFTRKKTNKNIRSKKHRRKSNMRYRK